MLAALHKQPPWDTSIEERRREAQMVMFGSVESLLKATSTRPEQARGSPSADCQLRVPVVKHKQRLSIHGWTSYQPLCMSTPTHCPNQVCGKAKKPLSFTS